MMFTAVEIALGIIGLSAIVLIHEGGHYIAARMSGIRVEVFSVGFGRRLAGFRRGDTDFRLSLIPLGGYCRFFGEKALRRALDEKLPRIPVSEGEFYGSSPLKRIFVSISGPAANILFSICVFTAIYWIGYEERFTEPKIVLSSEFSETGTLWPADAAGLQTGDLIIESDGKEITRFSELRRRVIFRPGETFGVTVLRDGMRKNLFITPALDKPSGRALIGVMSWVDPVVDSVRPAGSAEETGFQAGDRIIEIDGIETPHTVSVFSALASAEGKAVETVVSRGGRSIALQWVIPQGGDPGLEFRLLRGRSKNLGFLGALLRGSEETWSIMTATVRSIRLMFMGIELQNAVAGPLRLISGTGAAVAAGFRSGFGPGLRWALELMALLSVSLAFLNLLPIPVLDGGQILLFLIELVRRRALNPRSVYRYQFIGTIIVLAIAAAAMTGDVLHMRNQ